ncbi:MAG: hypothetical protein Q8Q84_13130 [Hydrogenophaga sp.]|nr:hypothetical protein [Hydrogenophaga sp.]
MGELPIERQAAEVRAADRDLDGAGGVAAFGQDGSADGRGVGQRRGSGAQ